MTDIILNNPKLISKSYKFISIILNGLIDNNVESIYDNLETLQKNQKLYIDSICKVNNDSLNEIIINIFEKKLNSYFDSIPKLKEEKLKKYFPIFYEYLKNHEKKNISCTLLDKSLELFNQCLNFLEKIYKNNKKETINNELICKLYCISFVKMYLSKCIYYNFTDYQDFPDFNKILDTIEGQGNNNLRKMIKIYVFKIFFNLLNNNYHDFINYNYSNHGITFYEEFKDKFNENKVAMLNYYLFPNFNEINKNNEELKKKYNEELDLFEQYRFDGFQNVDKNYQKFIDYIENEGIDFFYTISSNIIISNLSLNNYLQNSNEYSKYSSFAKKLFGDKLNIPKTTKSLFLLFSNDEEFKEKIKSKLNDQINNVEINQKQFEILIYSLRFCLQITYHKNPDEFLYSQIITENYENKLKENCLPGNNLFENEKVISYYQVVEHFNTQPDDFGAYVCSCGKYYIIPPCGFPWEEEEDEDGDGEIPQVKCLNCQLDIGHAPKPEQMEGLHGMVLREGHYRIFKNQEQKTEQMNEYGDTDENIPNMLLDDYKTKIIDPILKNSIFGINQIKKDRFDKIGLKVRNLSIIGYRLLNFILYSHLFFSQCLGYITEQNMSKYICEGLSCIEMLEIDWDLLKDALQSKGIQIIQIFMNMIFDKICEKLKNCKEIKNYEDLVKFEEEIEKLLEESYKEYNEYSKKYLEINQEALQIDKYNMKSLMLENNDVNDYDENKYPFYRLFLMTTYPTKENFINELKKVPYYERKYPLLNLYLLVDNKEKELIKYLPDFNEFTNFMIDNYSYKVSREEASNKLIKDEDIYKMNQGGFKDKFKRFINIWKKLKVYATKYGCRDDMPEIDLDENKSLAHFLNDNGELCKGMYIAAAYQKFINWQNVFLDRLIEPLRQSGILHHFVKNMKKKIDIQKAKKNEVLNFDKINELFMEIIYENSKRNVFMEDDKINYLNYKQFIYDFESIEKKLGEIILPGKVKFNENLKFVTYCFEGFRGDKSSVIADYEGKYQSISLTNEKKQKIYDSIKDKIQNKNNDLTKLLFSIQLLIYYLTQDRRDDNDDINVIIGNLPDYVNLSKECIDFLKKQELKVKELSNLFSYIELLCFQHIIDNLRDFYKKEIDGNIEENIKNLFEENKLKIITKIDLASACRKLISRYLVSMRDDTDYNENSLLVLHLDREELWPKDYSCQKNELLKNDLDILSKYELTIGQCYKLYNLLGGDENKVLEGINIKTEEKKDEFSEKTNKEGPLNFIKKRNIKNIW